MKLKLYKGVTHLLLFVSIATLTFSCKKESSPKDRRIKIEELLDYQIVEEYTPNADAAQYVGTYPILQVSYLTKDGNDFFVQTTQTYSFTMVVGINELDYDESTGISKLYATFGHYELTRDNNNNIQIIRSVHDVGSDFPTSMYFKSSHVQLIKLNTSKSFDVKNYYKASNADTYYGFNNGKWFYRTSGPITDNHFTAATWTYTKLNAYLWYGIDGGSAKLKNEFLIIPKGNGWKGEHVDKDLLLVGVLGPHSSVVNANGPYGIYILQN